MPPKITCSEVHEGLTEYLENALSPDERQGIDGHLASCEECRVLLDDLRATILATSRTTRPSIPGSTRETLIQVFKRSRPR